MAGESFHMLLPSNASPTLRGDNLTGSFIVDMPRHVNLKGGQWEAALLELNYPATLFNIRPGHNKIRLHTNIQDDEIELPTGTCPSPLHLITMINVLLKDKGAFIENDFLALSRKNFTLTNPIDGVEGTLEFSPTLARQLGFEKDKLSLSEKRESENYCSPHLGAPTDMYVYMDILENTFVGHVLCPLLRTVPVNYTSLDGTGRTISHPLEHALYVPIANRSFNTLEINIKDAQGDDVLFTHGTSSLLVHFRKVS